MKYCLLFLCILFFTSCSTRDTIEDASRTTIKIDLDASLEGNYSDIFDGIRYILLDPGPDEYLIRPYQITFKGDFIFVEERGKGSLHIYNADGHFKNIIKPSGRGPGEFNLMEDYQLKGEEIIIKDNTLNKFIAFDHSGNFLREWKPAIVSNNFLELEEATLHYMDNQSDGSGFNIITETRIVNTGAFPIRKGYETIRTGLNNTFFEDESRNAIWFSLPNSFEVARFNKQGDLAHILIFDFGSYMLTDENRLDQYNNNSFQENENLMMIKDISDFFPMENQFFISVKQGSKRHRIIMDDNLNIIKQYYYLTNDLDGMGLPPNIWTSASGEIIMRMGSTDFYNNYIKSFSGKTIKVTPGSVHEFFQNHKEKLKDDQHVLIALKLKDLEIN